MKSPLFTPLTLLLLCPLYITSCKTEETIKQESKDSEVYRSPSDFPKENQITSEMIFSEATLNSWGYLTTEVAEQHHAIRSEKNHGNASRAFYARFHITKAKFKNHTDASTTKNRMEALLESDAGFKNYTEIIQQDATLYAISPTSNYTFLSHQPKLMKMIRAHLEKGTKP